MTDSEPPEIVHISLGEIRYVPAPDQPASTQSAPPIAFTPSIGNRIDRIGTVFTDIRSASLNGLILLTFIAMIALTVSELRRAVVVIDPIGLPQALKQMGYSEDVAAYRLWDEVLGIYDDTPTAKDRVTLLPSSQKMDFEAPGAGISLQAVVQVLRPFFGLEETRIAGEFICATATCDPDGLALRLRVFRDTGMRIISLPPIVSLTDEAGLNRYFRSAAVGLLRELDPYVVAFYLFQSDKVAAENEALQLIGPTNPQRKWALNLLGYIAADRREYDAAIGWYKRAVAADEDDAFVIAYANWGNALRDKGDPDGAIQKYARALEIDPNYVFAYNNWGNALTDKGDVEGAIGKHAQAAKLDPQDAFTFNSWGNALFTKGDMTGAIEKYTRSTELDPLDALAYYNWGVALDELGDQDAAIEKFIRATELNPEDSGAYTNWGIALNKQGNLDQAIEKFKRAIEIDPDNSRAYNNWGFALGNLVDLDGALEKFTRATELDPGYPDAHFNKAIALQALGRASDAADAFERYLVLYPDSKIAKSVEAQIKELRAAALTK